MCENNNFFFPFFPPPPPLIFSPPTYPPKKLGSIFKETLKKKTKLNKARMNFFFLAKLYFF